MCVFSGILEHLITERSDPPVGQLVLLVSYHSTVALEQVCKAKALQLKNPCSLTCVEHIYDIDSKISLQPLDIHVSSMQHLDFFWIVENSS